MGLSTALSAQSVTKSALFVGNSYIYYFDLPGLISDMALSGGDTLVYDESAIGGYTLGSHLGNATTMNKVSNGNWNYLILQEQSQIPSLPDFQVQTQFYPDAIELDSIFRANHSAGKTVFYMTWGRENGDASNCAFWPPVCTYEGMDSLIQLRYRTIADSLNAVLSPVGALWHGLRNDHPGIDLYDPDGSHPTLAGSFAAACSFYAVLFQKDPALISFNAGLDTGTAGKIKRKASDLVFDQLHFWNVDTTAVQTPPLIINEVLYDPSNTALLGDANGDGVYDQEHDSFIEFINLGSVCFDAGGIQIWDDEASGQLRHTIAPGTIIPAGGALVVFGGGNPTGSFGGALVQTASSSANGLSLNNSGEVIAIKDALGNTFLNFDSDALSNNPDESYTRNPDIVGAFEQHNDNFPIRYSPGTAVDGTPFGTAICAPLCSYLNPQLALQSKYAYTASWAPDSAATLYSFEFKKASDANYTVQSSTNSSVTVNFPGPGTYDIRVGGLVNGVFDYSCVESFEVECVPVNAGIIVFKAPFCATSPATYRVNFSGGVGIKTFLWNNGSTARSITVPPGTYSCTVSDVYGCDTTVSISSGVPAGSFESTTLLSVVKAGANFTVNWNAKAIPGAVVLGYRAGYRVQGSGLPFVTSGLLGGTSHVFNLSGLCNANYEFTVFVRYQYSGQPAATSAPACSISRGHNNGPGACKGEGGVDAFDEGSGFRVYPNPSSGFVYVELPIGGDVLLLDLSGRILERGRSTEGSVSFDLSAYAAGVYMIQANVNGMVSSSRLIRE